MHPARFVLPALIVANAAIKLLWLGTNELAHDEPFTVYWSQRPFADLWEMLGTENNPPLYFLLIKIWSSFTPFEAAWLRAPSAIFSALAVWPLFLLGRALGGMRLAVIASLLFTCCNYHYGYAHEVRGYSLFTLLAVTTMWQLWRVSQRERGALLWLTITGTVMVYTHFFGWLMLGTALLCALLVKDLRPARRAFPISIGIIALLYLPYAAIFLGRLGTSVEQGTWLTAPEPEEIYNMIWRWSNAPVLAVLFLLLIVASVVHSRLRGSATTIGLLWTFVPLFGMFLASYITPMFLDRYLVYAAPGFTLLVATSIERIGLPERMVGILAALAVAGMAFTFAPWRDNGLHPSRVVTQVDAWRKGGEPLLLQPWWYAPTYAWHKKPDLLRSRNDLQWELGKALTYPVQRATDLPVELSAQDGVVLVDSGADLVDPMGSLKAALRRTFTSVDSVEADKKVWVYRFHR